MSKCSVFDNSVQRPLVGIAIILHHSVSLKFSHSLTHSLNSFNYFNLIKSDNTVIAQFC